MSFQTVVSQQAVSENAIKNHSKRDSGFAEFFESVTDLHANKFCQNETFSNESGIIPYANYLGTATASKRLVHKNQPEDRIISPLEEIFKPIIQSPEITIFKKQHGLLPYWYTWTKRKLYNAYRCATRESNFEDKRINSIDELREETKKNAGQIETLIDRIKSVKEKYQI
ncbi:12351_t:CDS:2 [Ambispora gerdemannii]|uniref:12351_t:CDS:1 n=1 Tax=Ambispora gerdemannii TaxID=144530 RepID=A0A9N9C9S7_9GLOM|nr:12351_t:CDS:2 [Ambispora gerdemannii]